MNKLLNLTLLYDLYGDLLTDKKKTFFEMYYHENLSLNEIGEEYGITPQGVRDHLQKTEGLLLNYEEKLGFLEKENNNKKLIEEIQTTLGKVSITSTEQLKLQKLLTKLGGNHGI